MQILSQEYGIYPFECKTTSPPSLHTPECRRQNESSGTLTGFVGFTNCFKKRLRYIDSLTTSHKFRIASSMASGSNFDNCYAALIGLAENFRTASPPNIRLCVHCLQSVFALSPPPKIEARTHLQLGNILLTHTKNTDLARDHFEKAVRVI